MKGLGVFKVGWSQAFAGNDRPLLFQWYVTLRDISGALFEYTQFSNYGLLYNRALPYRLCAIS